MPQFQAEIIRRFRAAGSGLSLLAAVLSGCAGVTLPGGPPPPAPVEDGAAGGGAAAQGYVNPYGESATPESLQVDIQLPDPAPLKKLLDETRKSRTLSDAQKQARTGELEALVALAEAASGLDRHTIRTEAGDRARWEQLIGAMTRLAKLRAARLASGEAGEIGEGQIPARTGGSVRQELLQAVQSGDDGKILAAWDTAVSELPPEEMPLDVVPAVARAAARSGDPARAAHYLEGFLSSQQFDDLPTLTGELAGYLAAVGELDRARQYYQAVMERLKSLEPLGPQTRDRIAALERRDRDENARWRAKLIQAEAIFAYGTDYSAAHGLVADVMGEARDPALRERAQQIMEGFRQRRLDLLGRELSALQDGYFHGRTELDTVRGRIGELRNRFPETDLQPMISASLSTMEAQKGKASAERAELDRQKLLAAELAVREGKFPEAVYLLRELSGSPTENRRALELLPAAIDGVVQRQREQAADAVVRALRIKDAAARRLALLAVQKQLNQLLADYPGTAVQPAIEKDLKLLDSQIDKLTAQLGLGQPADGTKETDESPSDPSKAAQVE